ncbi:AraC family transcriptional regulator [Povalibacter sp.]|uniref:AraC family transcriptional regulator n=1 Tax=Povalibacter sp. TaxID=1962978 RepID=UPI002F428921
MAIATLLQRESINVVDYRCNAGPDDRPFPEQHRQYSISFVRRGSFGCHIEGEHYELVAGSVFIGHPGGEYLCTHDHHGCGDECLSFGLSAEVVDMIAGPQRPLWRTRCVAPLPQLMIVGELAQVIAAGNSDMALDEAGVLLAAKYIEVVSGQSRRSLRTHAQARRRAVEAAMWIDANSQHAIDFEQAARQVGLSSFHFLRLFAAIIGVTPHQYLVRSRLRHAARLLADEDRPITAVALDVGFNDLSNFVRTFHRAAGMSPRDFRRAARGDRRIFREMMAPAARA